MERGKIGARIRMWRERRKLTVEQLAEKTALDPQFIEAVENGAAAPALGPMVKLARALGTRLGTFTDDELTEDPCITRSAERTPDSAVQASGGKCLAMTYHHLGQGKADRNMEPFFIRLEPEACEPTLSSHEGEEFVVVVSGQVVLRYGQEEHVLSAGDSMYYNSVVPHHVGAGGGQAAEIYAVIHVPF
ncbi:XRE family transcriptional regulator [Desulfocurvus sp.]|jgi:transcriptional regulator with XRE-family HTH domain|uniref:helix-turn-helix domain-containing protein n=1 Tax=Desulfocurvus sp. TaxID=2871698 RepID=UPI0025C4413F|nr:XRE family transcriptional regulator [Desulfocurvus sp.]MCK9241406.1 XRE family transcriptional regulator [Desulfocurvus sp.]